MVFSGIRKFLHGKRRGRPTNLTTYAKKAQPYGVALAADIEYPTIGPI